MANTSSSSNDAGRRYFVTLVTIFVLMQNNFYGKTKLSNDMVDTSINNVMEYIEKNYVRLHVYILSNSIEACTQFRNAHINIFII